MVASKSSSGSDTSASSGKTARERCYEEIVTEVKMGLSRFYAEYPERLGDERSTDAVSWSTRGVTRILRILDKYSIEHLPNPAQEKGGK